MNNILLIGQVLASVILIGLILLQQRGTALGSAFGGESGGFYMKRRGLEKKILISTIIISIIFVALSIVNLTL